MFFINAILAFLFFLSTKAQTGRHSSIKYRQNEGITQATAEYRYQDDRYFLQLAPYVSLSARNDYSSHRCLKGVHRWQRLECIKSAVPKKIRNVGFEVKTGVRRSVLTIIEEGGTGHLTLIASEDSFLLPASRGSRSRKRDRTI